MTRLPSRGAGLSIGNHIHYTPAHSYTSVGGMKPTQLQLIGHVAPLARKLYSSSLWQHLNHLYDLERHRTETIDHVTLNLLIVS